MQKQKKERKKSFFNELLFYAANFSHLNKGLGHVTKIDQS